MEEEKKKFRLGKKSGCLLAIAVLIIFIAALSGGDKDETNTTTTPVGMTEEEINADMRANSEYGIVVSAADLAAAYEANQISADNTYLDKIVNVSGVVSTIGKDILDKPYVTLKTQEVITTVQCYIKSTETEKASTIKEGDTVTFIGKVEGKSLNVVVKDCIFLE